MNTRKKDRFDYKVYHESGVKAPVASGKTMDPNQVPLEELKIVDDLDHNLALYSVADLSSEEELSEGIGVISKLGQYYRHVHVELKAHLKENHGVSYPKYDQKLKEINTYLKSARTKIRESKKKVQDEKDEDKKSLVQVEFDILRAKVLQANDLVDVNVGRNDVEIDKYVTRMEGFIEEFFSLVAKIRTSCPDSLPEFEEDFATFIYEIEQDIKLARLLKRRIFEFKDASKQNVSFQAQLLKSVTSAEHLKTEISYRFKSLSKRFDLDLDNLGDYQLLELSQQKNDLQQEFNSILGKITDLSSLVSTGGQPVGDIFEKMCRTRDRLCHKRDGFFAKLQNIILDRDITADKLKFASELSIELPKFSGYDSKMDLYKSGGRTHGPVHMNKH